MSADHFGAHVTVGANDSEPDGSSAAPHRAYRSELTPLERSEHIAEWLRITEKKLQSAQVEPIEKSKREDGRGHRKPSGVKAASREINVERNEAQRTKGCRYRHARVYGYPNAPTVLHGVAGSLAARHGKPENSRLEVSVQKALQLGHIPQKPTSNRFRTLILTTPPCRA